MLKSFAARFLLRAFRVLAAVAVFMAAAGPFDTTVRAQSPPITFTVNTLADDTGDGTCSVAHCTLREAVSAANALAGTNTVAFAEGLSGIIRLQSVLPTISGPGNVTINGGGRITISGDKDGNGTGDVTGFVVSASGVLTLNDLTITKMNATGSLYMGAGINAWGQVAVSGCVFSSNSAASYGAAIASYNRLTIDRSAFTSNSVGYYGGALYLANGPAVISNTSFIGNGSQQGGAIYTSPPMTLTVTNSTFGGNTGNGSSAGGGAMSLSNTALRLINNTFVGNTAINGAGGISVYNDGTKDNVLSNNVFQNNIRTGNGSITNCVFGGSAPVDGGHNIEDANGCGFGSASLKSTNARLTTWGSYGGIGQTVALLPGSPAIDFGDDAICAAAIGTPTFGAGGTDARGVSRTGFGAHCDAGAFESRGFMLTSTSGAGQTAALGAAFGSPLVVTASSANAEPVSGGVVTFSPPAGGATATITGSPATIASNGTASVTAVAAGVAGIYLVTASSAGVTTTAVLDLANTGGSDAAAAVTVQPADKTVAIGATATFGASATGMPVPVVQWQVSGDNGLTFTDIPGANSASYSFTAAGSQNTYKFRARFTNGLGVAFSNAGTLTVIKAPATLSLTAADLSVTYDGSQKTVRATSSPAGLSGIVVTYTGISGTSYSASTTPPTNAGSYSVVASLTNDNYQATDVTGTLVISKASAALALGALTFTYDGTAKPVSVTTTPSGLSGVSVTYDGSVTAPTNAGSYAVVASVANANFQAANASGTLVISKASASVSLGGLRHTYDGTAKAATASTTPPGLTVSVTYDGSATVPVNAGSYEVVATISDGNYSGSASGTLVISKASATLTLGTLTFTYDGTAKAVSVTTAPSGLSGVGVTYEGSATAPTDAASYAVVASLTNANYQAANATGTLVISKASASVNVGGLSHTYDGTAKAATTSTTPTGLTVSVTYDGSATVPVNAGSYAVVATISDANYSGSASGTLVIGKASAALTLGTLTFTYDGTAKAVSVTTTPSGLNGVSVTYEGSATAPTNAGSYAVVASLTNANYQAANASGTLVISKASASVSLGGLSHTYDGTAKAATTSTTPTGLTVSVTYDGSATVPVNAGSYAVVATISDANYSGSASGTLVIGKASATLALGTLTFTYDGTAKAVAATTTPSGLSGVSVTYDGSATAPTNAGSYAVVASLTNTNYQATNVTGTLAIAKASATVALGGLTQTYDGAAKSATATTTPAGLKVVITHNGLATVPVNAGTYAVVAAIDEPNYTGSASGTLTIAKAAATLAFGQVSFTYDGNPKPVTVTTTPASLSGVSITYDGGATAPTNAGSYAVVASLTHANYQAANISASLVISKASGSITLGGLSQTYDGTAKSVTTSTAPAGLTVNVTYNGSATVPVNAGSYSVAATISEANYSGTANGTLVISKANATLALGTLTFTYDGTAKAVSVTTTPASLTGVSVTYDGSSTPPTSAGSYAVVASLANANYQAANATGTLVISKASATVTLGDLSHVYDGTPKSATASTTPSGLTVKVTYDGSTTAPTNAGSYTVVAAIEDATYSGSATGTLAISKATATLALGTLSFTYDGSAKPVTVATTPSGLSGVTVKYDGVATAPTNAGSYAVVAALANANYQATDVSGTLVISNPAPVIAALSPTSAFVSGAAFTLTVTGSSFVDGATLLWNGSPRTTTWISSSELSAEIAAADLAAASTVDITVQNVSPALATSNVIRFLVKGSVPVFTDDPLVSGQNAVRATHILELRRSIDDLRSRYGLSAFTWTDASITAGVTQIKGVHLTELRTALGEVYSAAGRTAPTYTDAAPSGLAIKAVHISEIREAIKGIW